MDKGKGWMQVAIPGTPVTPKGPTLQAKLPLARRLFGRFFFSLSPRWAEEITKALYLPDAVILKVSSEASSYRCFIPSA